jgi:hypothetical protein
VGDAGAAGKPKAPIRCLRYGAEVVEHPVADKGEGCEERSTQARESIVLTADPDSPFTVVQDTKRFGNFRHEGVVVGAVVIVRKANHATAARRGGPDVALRVFGKPRVVSRAKTGWSRRANRN